MIVYWFLLLITSIIAYGLGSMSTMVLASNYVFRTRLSRLGKGNIWISNFRRIYGVWGFVRLLLVELVKDLLPILLGGLLLGLKGHAQVGYVFAGFCLTLGRLFALGRLFTLDRLFALDGFFALDRLFAFGRGFRLALLHFRKAEGIGIRFLIRECSDAGHQHHYQKQCDCSLHPVFHHEVLLRLNMT